MANEVYGIYWPREKVRHFKGRSRMAVKKADKKNFWIFGFCAQVFVHLIDLARKIW